MRKQKKNKKHITEESSLYVEICMNVNLMQTKIKKLKQDAQVKI